MEELDSSNVRGKEDLPAFLDEVGSESAGSDLDIDIDGVLEKGDTNYDEGGVVACPVCKSLYLLEGRYGREMYSDCGHCGFEVRNVDLIRYESIFSYLEDNEGSEDTDFN